MPMNRAHYPENWEALALAIKTEANWTCEGCGKQCRRPGETLAELAERLQIPLPELQAGGRQYETVTLAGDTLTLELHPLEVGVLQLSEQWVVRNLNVITQ